MSGDGFAAGFAGVLNQLVTVERRVSSPDDLGGDGGVWEGTGQSWAGITAEPARPGSDGEGLSVRQRYRIEMRDNAAIGLRHRLVWKGRALTLLSIERDPARPGRMRMIAEVRP